MTTCLVVGAHGRTGSRVVDELVQAGHAVTGLVRRGEHVADLHDAGAHGIVLDLATSSTDDLQRAVDEVEAVVYTAGSSSGATAETVTQIDGAAIIRTVDAAVLAGAERFVLVSAHRADEDFGGDHVVRLLRAKRAADAHLRATALAWTIIRPDALTEGRPTGRVRLGTTVPQGALPRADLARLIRLALEAPPPPCGSSSNSPAGRRRSRSPSTRSDTADHHHAPSQPHRASSTSAGNRIDHLR